jgi:hypothetical protein
MHLRVPYALLLASLAFSAILGLGAWIVTLDGMQSAWGLRAWFACAWTNLALTFTAALVAVLHTGPHEHEAVSAAGLTAGTVRRTAGLVHLLVVTVVSSQVINYWYRFDGEGPGSVSATYSDTERRYIWDAHMHLALSLWPWSVVAFGGLKWAYARETLGAYRKVQ